MIDPKRAAFVMRNISGKLTTPPLLRDEAQELENAGLISFREWPSGYWKITDKGRAFLLQHGQEE
jgi:hypothetical protein